METKTREEEIQETINRLQAEQHELQKESLLPYIESLVGRCFQKALRMGDRTYTEYLRVVGIENKLAQVQVFHTDPDGRFHFTEFAMTYLSKGEFTTPTWHELSLDDWRKVLKVQMRAIQEKAEA